MIIKLLRMVFFLCVMILFISIILLTPAGLSVSLRMASAFLPGKLTYANASGSILGPIEIKNLSYENKQVKFQIGKLYLRWQPRRLLAGYWHISELKANAISILTKSWQKLSNKKIYFADLMMQGEFSHNSFQEPPNELAWTGHINFTIGVAQDSIQCQIEHSQQWRIKWDARLSNLHLWGPSVQGQLYTQGTFFGTFQNYNTHGTALLKNFIYEENKASEIASHWQVDSVSPLKSSLAVTGKNIFLNNIPIKHFALRNLGNLQQQQITGDFFTKLGNFHFLMNGQYRAHIWQVIFQRFNWQDNFTKWTLIHPMSMRIFTAAQPLHGTIHIRLSNFQWLNFFTKMVKVPQGSLLGDLAWQGSLRKPLLRGNLQLKNGSIVVPTLNLRFTQAGIVLQAQQQQLNYRITAMAGNSPAVIVGHGQWTSSGFVSQFTLNGNHLLLINTPEYKIYTSLQIQALLQGKQLLLTGNVVIPQANIQLKDWRNVVTLPTQDIIYVGGKTPAPSTFWQIGSHIRLVLSHNIFINAMGFKGRIYGDVILNNRPGQILLATGKIGFLNSSYTNFGHVLQIDPTSYLQYIHNPIDNPHLNVRASRNINIIRAAQVQSIIENKYTVGVQVQGTAKSPALTLYSIPANLSQNDILSYLILGEASNTSTVGNLTLLAQGLNLLKFGGGGAGKSGNMIKNLQQSLGFSEFGIESGTTLDAIGNPVKQQTSFVIGRKLSKRLYIRYSREISGIGLTDINEITLRYLLSKHWAMQANTSNQGTGGDVLYTIEK